ncbi:hypothetical protein [Paenibacillus larvae]|uniref:Uncharacterized protein n=1 Tax=Paenibacillus larvae subsp. larvae TaxID=147375 RepID=A0A6C0QX78_9BACL|nr:hypothetical protein [Paenibacillus larvae]QHZ53385.1 hypothetical protein ERICV_04334 [Paenibacillus larvae subsp. larvae]
MKVYNGEKIVITVVSDGNEDVTVHPQSIVEINLDLMGKENPDGKHRFNDDSFYILEEGDWYAKTEHCGSGADIEIYAESLPQRIINLTPHEVTIMDDQKQVVQRIPSSGNARVQQTREVIGEINDIPVNQLAYGETEDLPEPQEGVVYIVSSLTAQAVPGRTDIYVPDDLVRDEAGRIIGCRALGRI